VVRDVAGDTKSSRGDIKTAFWAAMARKYISRGAAEGTPLSDRHQCTLARLVYRYGPDAVSAAVAKVPPKRPRGRPPRGNLPQYENAHLAQCIDELAEEFRQHKSRTPIGDAEHALYEMIFTKEQQREDGHFVRWQKNIKKKRLDGRRTNDLAMAIAADFRRGGK
jgi:hypothetical protein